MALLPLPCSAVQVIEDFGRLEGIKDTAASIGVYDGVHVGHQAVILQLLSEADRLGVAPAVVTFDRHPALVLRPENAPKLLNSLDQKLEAARSVRRRVRVPDRVFS